MSRAPGSTTWAWEQSQALERRNKPSSVLDDALSLKTPPRCRSLAAKPAGRLAVPKAMFARTLIDH